MKSKVEFFSAYGRKQYGGLEKLDNSQVLFKTNFPPTGYSARQSAAPALEGRIRSARRTEPPSGKTGARIKFLTARGALNRLAGELRSDYKIR